MKLTYDGASEKVLPPEGPTPAVCVDFIDLGLITGGKFGDKHKVQLVFETPHRHPDQGWPLRVSARMNVSFHPESTLRKFLQNWRGKRYTDEEAKAGVDMEACVGRPAYVTIQYSEDGQYANIANIIPLPPGMTAPDPDPTYVRVKEKEGGYDLRSPHTTATDPNGPPVAPPVATERPAMQPAAAGGGGPFPDDDLPFAPTRH